jgi:threonine/homoserine/homoserine lactone efflux protein
MTWQLFIALLVFSSTAAFSPGPNNTLLMASGIAHGFRRSLPLVLGVAIGFPVMIGCVGLGLGKIFEIYPVLYLVLKYAGAAYMLYLAWKIATAKYVAAGALSDARPMSFIQASLFQWINPKAWIMAVTALSAYTVAADYMTGVAVVVATFVCMGLTSASTWALFGAKLRHLFNDERYFRGINLMLAGLLVISLVPLLWH